MKNVIIDTDNSMGIPFRWNDDGLAILYSFGEQLIDVIGITTVFGNASVKKVYKITNKLLNAIHKEEIPIRKGAEKEGDINTEASKFLIEKVDSNPGNITILALGPLTNLYAAQEKDPRFFSKLKEIILMGGITKERLTIGRTKIKDANLKNDLSAALEVINAECPVSIINCHLCKQVPFKKDYLKKLGFWPDIFLNKLENEFWIHQKVHHVDLIYIWDVLVPIYLTHPEIFDQNKVKLKASNLDDISEGRLEITDKNGTLVNMPKIINNKNKFYEILINSWRNLDEEIIMENQEYINFKNNKYKMALMKKIFALIIPLFLRLMYKKEGKFYYEE